MIPLTLCAFPAEKCLEAYDHYISEPTPVSLHVDDEKCFQYKTMQRLDLQIKQKKQYTNQPKCRGPISDWYTRGLLY